MPLLIRRAAIKDAAAFARIMSESEVYAGLMQMPYPDEEMWRAHSPKPWRRESSTSRWWPSATAK